MALTFAGIAVAVAGTVGFAAAAPTPASDFSLQVSPSPLVETLKPGTDKTIELKIRNSGTGTEELKIEPRKFTVEQNGKVGLDDATPSEIAQWITFSAPKFTIKPGEWYTQKIRIALPKDTGFSYSLALVISRTATVVPTEAGRLIKGSLAVFTLINVDRPGAIRRLEVDEMSTSADIYEYLPAKIDVKFKNVGNVIVQPYGNIFITQGSGDGGQVATLPVNDKGGYILPGTERLLGVQWSDGFPRYETVTNADGSQTQKEIWDWSQVAKLRIGKYTAKLVAVYNDGKRDVPIEREVSFWVLPWKIILGGFIILVILGFGVWSILRSVFRALKRGKSKRPKVDSEDTRDSAK